MRYIVNVPSFGVTLALLQPCTAYAEPIEVIKKAWTAREARLESCKLEWTQKYYIPKGGYGDSMSMKDKSGVSLPKQDLDYGEKITVAIKADKFRFEYEGMEYHPERETLTSTKSSAIYDGAVGIDYRDQPYVSVNVGARSDKMGHDAIRRADTIVMLWSCRPCADGFRVLDIDTFKLTGRTRSLNGQNCFEVSANYRNNQISWSLWIAPSADYSIIQAMVVDHTPSALYRSTKYEIEYSECANSIWLPKRWVITNQGKSMPISRKITADLISCSTDHPVTAKTFDSTAPNKSMIHEVVGEQSRTYIVRPDGSVGEVDSNNRGSMYLEASGDLAPSSRDWVTRSKLVISVVGAVVVFFLIIWVLVKLIHRARTPPH